MSYRISWVYDSYNPVIKRKESDTKRDLTTCIIEKDGQVLAKATVGCYYKDSNNRKVARRESFKKAVETNFTGRNERKEVWGAFKAKFTKCINC